MRITCLGYKRDMRGKHHVYGSLEYTSSSGTSIPVQFWGECSSGYIHFRNLTFWEMRLVPKRIKDRGYKPLLAERLGKSFPKVVDAINQELLVRTIRGN